VRSVRLALFDLCWVPFPSGIPSRNCCSKTLPHIQSWESKEDLRPNKRVRTRFPLWVSLYRGMYCQSSSLTSLKEANPILIWIRDSGQSPWWSCSLSTFPPLTILSKLFNSPVAVLSFQLTFPLQSCHLQPFTIRALLKPIRASVSLSLSPFKPLPESTFVYSVWIRYFHFRGSTI